jgi:hypothetical protein
VKGLDPFVAADAVADTDGDGASNYDEYTLGTDPLVNPNGYGAAILADTPIGYWPLDDANTTALDASVSHFNGTYTPTYTQLVTGAISSGTAVTFPNTGYVTVPHNAALNIAGDYSIELFMRWTTTTTASAFSKRSGTVGPQVFTSYPSTGKVQLIQNGFSSQLIASTSAGLNDNHWRHYVFIRRGSQLEIWINGVLDNTATASVIAFTNTQPLQIGNGQYLFNGSLDEVAFYNRALSPLDVYQHWRQKLAPPLASIQKPGNTLYASIGSGEQGPTPVLLSDIRFDDPSLWMYDPMRSRRCRPSPTWSASISRISTR